MILIDVNGQSLFVRNPAIVEESVKYLKVYFDFTNDWDGYSKTAVFKGEEGEAYEVILDENSLLYAGDGAFFVPHEVIIAPSFSLSLVGSKDDSKITTESVKIKVNKCGASEGLAPSEPTPDAFSQMSQMCSEAMEGARQVVELAEEIEVAQKEAAENCESASKAAQEAEAASKAAQESMQICEEAVDFVEEKTNENALFSANCTERAEQISADKEVCENAKEACIDAKEKTEAAKLTLEEGVEWVFDGGKASTLSIDRLLPAIDFGSIYMKSLSGSFTTEIKFKRAFSSTPIVLISSSVSNVKELTVVSANNVTTTGFKVNAYSTTSQSQFRIYWTAIGN